MGKCIGIVTVRGDLHADVIAHHLSKFNNVKTHIFEVDCVGDTTCSNLHISNCQFPVGAITDKNGSSVNIANLDLIWWRRPRPKQIVDSSLTDQRHIELINNDSEYAIFGLFYSCFNGTWINNPISAILAENKAIQLLAAKRCGLQIPDTLISNSVNDVITFTGQQRSIVKTVRGLPDKLLATSEYAPLEENLSDIKHSPAIYQQYVCGSHHVRAVAFGGVVLAAGYHSTKIDSRFDSQSKMVKVELEQSEKQSIKDLLSELGLIMGVLDFKRDKDGNFIFLEINQQGQFIDLEWRAEMEIGKIFAEKIISL